MIMYMLYTGNGDDGTIKTFGCDQRISKSSAIAEALGSVDEINSYLGVCKMKAIQQKIVFNAREVNEVLQDIQEVLFIVQAELAGADKKVEEEKIIEMEVLIKKIEEILPPVKTFFISGGTELASMFDFARTIARRAERRVVQVNDGGIQKINPNTLKYLNRLSSALFALARLINHLSGVGEQSPNYK